MGTHGPLLVTLRNTLVGFGPGLFFGYGLVALVGLPCISDSLSISRESGFIQMTK
jgi:hypothetical protein